MPGWLFGCESASNRRSQTPRELTSHATVPLGDALLCPIADGQVRLPGAALGASARGCAVATGALDRRGTRNGHADGDYGRSCCPHLGAGASACPPWPQPGLPACLVRSRRSWLAWPVARAPDGPAGPQSPAEPLKKRLFERKPSRAVQRQGRLVRGSFGGKERRPVWARQIGLSCFSTLTTTENASACGACASPRPKPAEPASGHGLVARS